MKGNMGTANGIGEKPDLESLSTNDDGARDVGQELDDLTGEGPSSSASFYSPSSPAKKKKSCCPNCLNKSLIGLKALLFLFYGGIGVLVTWLNHLEISRRFTEKECLLVYGLSSLLSAFTPFVFGIISDKSGQPRRVLAVCLLLAGLCYPLILTVPPADPHDYQTRLSRSNLTFRCNGTSSKLISNSSACGSGCGGSIVLSKCEFVYKNGTKDVDSQPDQPDQPGQPDQPDEPDYGDGAPEAAAQIDRPSDATGPEEVEGEDQNQPWTPQWPPHVCLAPGTHDLNSEHSNKSLCYAFDENRKNISINVGDIAGHEDDQGGCHYPLLHWSEELQRYEHMVNCAPIAGHLEVSCKVEWDPSKSDQWSCSSDFIQWAILFSAFVALHALGTMLLISAAGLLNVAILSMTHEHQGYFGCQLTYAALGFALLTPGAAHLFEYLKDFEIPWSLDYVAAYSIWLLLSAVLALTLPHHAEWVPKPGTIWPMLRRWSGRGHTVLFFLILVTLGGLQGLVDTLGFFQTKQLGATLIHLGFGGLAAMIPALIFIYRVEKVIEFCGYHNILAISLVVLSLQFTGYAYLRDVIPEWMYLLKALDTFSIVTVWAAAAHTTYNAAPRSLVASCQAIIVILYCSLGRGLGCCLGYGLRLFLSREVVLQGLSIASVIICILYLVSHYWALQPNPYSRHYDTDHGFAPRGKYTPLQLLQGQKGNPDKKSPTKASTEEAS